MHCYDEGIKVHSRILYHKNGGPLYWGVHQEKRGIRSSCMAEIKYIDGGIRGIQYLRHLMKQLGLPDVEYPTPLMNDNQGSINWIKSGCKPTKKLRHENLSELGTKEAREHKKVQLYWIAGSINPANLFTKKDNDIKHFETLRDQMVKSREEFAQSSTSTDTLNKIQTIGFNPDTLWGVLEQKLEDWDSEEFTPLTKSKSLTQHKYKDPNLGQYNGLGLSRSKIEVACE